MNNISWDKITEGLADFGWIKRHQTLDNDPELIECECVHPEFDLVLRIRYIVKERIWVITSWPASRDRFHPITFKEMRLLITEEFGDDAKAAITRFREIAENIDTILMEQAL